MPVTFPLSPVPRPPRPPRLIADLAASFQEAVVDCLVGKAMAALQQTGMRTLCVGGGVAANCRLRQRLAEESERRQDRTARRPHAALHRQRRHGRWPSNAGRPGWSNRSISTFCPAW